MAADTCTLRTLYLCPVKNMYLGNSLVVQRLGLGAFTAVDKVQSLVGELRSYTPRGIYQI